ncbi:hypothetical protein HHK36_002860 [Tetracentron sinense]|uniref:Small auxin up regulated protein n=1 Tax=Tetracentron sinense TaxID=13715 RepID=A0A834ZSA7_TETSI|nr:hypothetical protein HHK36_002860 [Tetracentron sinense]
MINPKRLIQMARKWQKVAAVGKKRILPSRNNGNVDADDRNKLVADKGHFVVYTTDRRRFVIPLEYLNKDIFIELLKMSEEEFGLPSDGPITLPCDALLMEYIVSLVQRRVSKDLEKGLLISIATGRCSSSSFLHQGQTKQQLLIHGF